jgi:hypothetical protein
MRTAFSTSVGKAAGKRPLGRRGSRCDVSVKMDLKGIGCKDAEYICLAHDRDQWWAFMNPGMNIQFQRKAGNFLAI